ncbi:MAG: transcription factor jumonji, JmjC [Sphingopyxis sp.]|uniref:transcription factor jumonji, JmjC n=1 Tax=Sphingopyxis sp. TaxID=1908224 RepID=UPI002AB84400|nr:transcription factor jumonji, JmjC [Sphingopyxis sp.]MDZ3832291.1 transcription factor jumonji, JmjC [Sphingopyxis sp.]
MSYVSPSGLQAFSSAYPAAPAMLRHELVDHPLLSFAALAQAARELPPQHVERRIADAVNGGDFAMDGQAGDDVAMAVESMQIDGNWIMLRFVEQLPAYRALLDTLMAAIAPAIAPVTGTGSAVKGFIFISAPGTLTPFHFDCEYNILFQIAGDKQFATYPPTPPWLTLDRREAYHGAGDNMLPWDDGFETAATIHPLSPGDALFVPYAAPHWVKAGSTPSISLSMTWQCEWSREAADAVQVNPLLRRVGLAAAEPPLWPASPGWRALCGRAARKVGLL